jgi:biotin-dependent carboxylase-like uncharacterized protein
MSFLVVNAGMQMITVDSGRQGKQHMGFSQSGPMDETAYFYGNALCRNYRLDNSTLANHSAPVSLECIGAVTLVANVTTTVAVTGPGAQFSGDNREYPLWAGVRVYAGQTLTITPHKLGTRHYLSVAGGFTIRPVIGSGCTVAREQLGGLNGNGSGVKAKDILPCASMAAPFSTVLEASLMPDYGLHRAIGVIPGYQFSWFNGLSQRRFTSSYYQVTPAIDRMGYRLSGENVAAERSQMYSEAIALGAVQIPANGQPIVMMSDRQTLGGYPKIGCIAPSDLPRVAQSIPNDELHFYFIDHEAARAKLLLEKVKRTQMVKQLMSEE